MIAFEVKDMTCGHCVGAITAAVKAVDGSAEVQVDLATHRVQISAGQSSSAGLDAALAAAIQDAGYTPVRLDVDMVQPAATANPAKRGCCCV